MNIRSKIIVSLGLVFLVGCDKRREEPTDSQTSFASAAIQKYVDAGLLPGAISVFYRDGVQEVACIGYADVAAKRPIALTNIFMQCSQTKGFCGVSIAMLVEQGKISLDDPVSKYLPEFRELWVEEAGTNGTRVLRRAKTELTVRMCLNHMGGFPFELANFEKMGGWSRRMPLRSVAATAAAAPLLFDPGEKVRYSNVGTDIGAAVVEVVTGQRWEDFLSERVFAPLGMEDSTFFPTEKQLATKIELYFALNGKRAEWRSHYSFMQRPYGDDRVFPSAGAGLWTTARDQLKFYKMLMNLGVGENGVRILKEGTVKSILAVSTRPQGYKGYSLGLSAPEKDGEDQWFGHGGAWGTNCSVNWHKKQLKLWVVQLDGWPRPWPWDKAHDEAAAKFFGQVIDTSGTRAYTGRIK